MGPDQPRFIELLKKKDSLTDSELSELRGLIDQDARSHVQNMALMRASIDNIEAIRRFDKASADLINLTNRLTKWVLAFTVIAVILGGASLYLSWLALQKNP